MDDFIIYDDSALRASRYKRTRGLIELAAIFYLIFGLAILGGLGWTHYQAYKRGETVERAIWTNDKGTGKWDLLKAANAILEANFSTAKAANAQLVRNVAEIKDAYSEVSMTVDNMKASAARLRAAQAKLQADAKAREAAYQQQLANLRRVVVQPAPATREEAYAQVDSILADLAAHRLRGEP